MKCPKCNYERTHIDTAPVWQCPKCGVAYDKVKTLEVDSDKLEARKGTSREFADRHRKIGNFK